MAPGTFNWSMRVWFTQQSLLRNGLKVVGYRMERTRFAYNLISIEELIFAYANKNSTFRCVVWSIVYVPSTYYIWRVCLLWVYVCRFRRQARVCIWRDCFSAVLLLVQRSGWRKSRHENDDFSQISQRKSNMVS